MTFEALTAIISVLTVGIAVGKIIYGLSKTLTRLNLAVENLNATLTEFTNSNESEHEELFGGVEELRELYSRLEMRIDDSNKEKN